MGEQPLLPYEACNLGSINLKNMYNPKTNDVNWEKLTHVTWSAVHFLDNVIDVNKYPIPEIDKMTRATRKIGLGVMGWADLLLLLGIPYGSDESLSLGHQIMQHIKDEAWRASNAIAETKGTYPAYDDRDPNHETPKRNATVTTIAPTGTLSIIANVSSGIEPIFAYAYYRNVMDTKLIEANGILIDKLKNAGIYSDELMDKIITQGTLAHIDEIPEEIRKVFVCAHDITPIEHISMQANFQMHTDNAVSKTVNFPNSATREDVKEVYDLAYSLGCKGTTIYRDGSRDSQVLNIGKAEEEKTVESVTESVVVEESGPIIPRDRTDETYGFTRKVRIGCGNLYITVNHDENGICEVFTNTGRAGGCPSQSEATARMVSIALRAGIDIKEVIRQLRGIRCPSCQRRGDVQVLSCPDAIGRALEEAYTRMTSADDVDVLETSSTTIEEIPTPKANNVQNASDLKFAKECPECGATLEHEGGCVMCRNCGWSKCG